MSQKLRTARGSIVIILALLCIVCLSISLAFSAHFAAFAEESGTTLPDKDEEGNYLWKVHYTDANGEPQVDDLCDGLKSDSTPITYLSNLTQGVVCTGNKEEKNFFVPFREGVEYTLKLNGNYKIGDDKLSDLYYLNETGDNAVVYENQISSGTKEMSVGVPNTKATVKAKLTGADELKISKSWMIATFCNTVNVTDGYVQDRTFAQSAGKELVKPEKGNIVVYDLICNGFSDPFGVKFTGDTPDYLLVAENGVTYDVIYDRQLEYDSEIVANVDRNLFNYKLRNLNEGNYTLKITALSPNDDPGFVSDDGIYYAASSRTIDFTVKPQPIGNLEVFKYLLGGLPNCVQNTYDYTEDSSWVSNVQLQVNGKPLSINGVAIQQGIDYLVVPDTYGVGYINLRFEGMGNLSESILLENAIKINPAQNDWNTLPNITPWNYGDYNRDLNKIVGLPLYPSALTEDNINDITFRIVSISTGEETEIEGLEGFHYVIEKDSNDIEQYVVSNEVATLLGNLSVGKYRMYSSVYGYEVDGAATGEDRRNYQPISAKSVDFSIGMGINSWDSANGVPSIISWTAGKYNPEVNTIKAIDRFGNEGLIIIRNGNGDIVYSSHEEHKDKDFGDISVLKKFKAGYYTLQAEVKGTENYNALNTVITFTIARNGLPAWAVIIIVAGALGIVALIFGLLHQKGVLQMLTGKVIISMRTRANVDATLAAIRAAKIAREAEASIAAAKAREAEEAAKQSKDENK